MTPALRSEWAIPVFHSLWRNDVIIKQCPWNTTFEEKGEWSRIKPTAYQRNTLPLGQTGSPGENPPLTGSFIRLAYAHSLSHRPLPEVPQERRTQTRQHSLCKGWQTSWEANHSASSQRQHPENGAVKVDRFLGLQDLLVTDAVKRLELAWGTGDVGARKDRDKKRKVCTIYTTDDYILFLYRKYAWCFLSAAAPYREL